MRLLFLTVFLVAIYAAFGPQIGSFMSKTYYSLNSGKSSNLNVSSYDEVLENDDYWSGSIFLLDKYMDDLGFSKRNHMFEAELRNNEKLSVWRCGNKRFTIDKNGNLTVGIVGDEWDELSASAVWEENGCRMASSGVLIENVAEETIVYIISSALSLRQNDNLRDVSQCVRDNIDNYRIKKCP